MSKEIYYIKDGKRMCVEDYDDDSHMISESDSKVTQEWLTKQELIEKYRHALTKEQIDKK